MARRKSDSSPPAHRESPVDAATPTTASDPLPPAGAAAEIALSTSEPMPVGESVEEASRPVAADPIMDEVQAFLQRRRELAQKLREEIELTQHRLEELQETLGLLQGEMSVAEEREKKAKKPKPKASKPPVKEPREPRTRTLFDDSPARDDEGETAATDEDARGRGDAEADSSESEETSTADSPALPNEAAVD